MPQKIKGVSLKGNEVLSFLLYARFFSFPFEKLLPMLLKSSILISLYPKRKGKETRILLLRDTQIEDLNQPS